MARFLAVQKETTKFWRVFSGAFLVFEVLVEMRVVREVVQAATSGGSVVGVGAFLVVVVLGTGGGTGVFCGSFLSRIGAVILFSLF